MKAFKLYILHAWNNMRSRSVYFCVDKQLKKKKNENKKWCVYVFNEYEIVSFGPFFIMVIALPKERDSRATKKKKLKFRYHLSHKHKKKKKRERT